MFFDIDDVFTSEKQLTAVACAAFKRLHAAGPRAIFITGRLASWYDHILQISSVGAAEIRARHRAVLMKITDKILAAVSGAPTFTISMSGWRQLRRIGQFPAER